MARFIILLLLSNSILVGKTIGQSKMPCNEITAEMGYKVGSVRIMGQWVPQELQVKVEQIVGTGQQFDLARVGTAMELIRDELTKSEELFAIQIIGATSVLYITADVCDTSDATHPKEVQITIYPYYLRIDLYNLANNILPVPRTARSTFYSHVPKALLATAPLLGVANDRRYGFSLMMQTTTDLLHLPGFIKPGDGSKAFRLDLGLDARISLCYPFHMFGASLALVHPVYSENSTGWDFGMRYEQSNHPLGLDQYRSELARIYGGIQGSWKKPLFDKYSFNAGARFSENRFNDISNNELQNHDNGWGISTLSEGRLGPGLTRLGVWFDAGYPSGGTDLKPYQRLAGRLGYATDLGNGHNSVGLEATLGSGYIWESTPPYSQFFAGNTAWNFLYDPLTSIRNRAFPQGPVIRSLGERSGGLLTSTGAVVGGTSYWHLNLNIAIPIPKWAHPLIPDITITDAPRRTLRSALKGAVETAKTSIIDDLVTNRGFPDDSTTEVKAERIINKDIRPTVNYLADRANVFSLKPLLLFDVAQINESYIENKTWLATGIGFQMNIVNARVETGYMHTVYPASESSMGNFFLRLTMQNFY